MVKNLQLAAGDLFTFALVYTYTQGYAGKYTGNVGYLSAWFGWTEKTSRGHLTNLVKKGLIVEERGRKDNVDFCHYLLAPDFYEKWGVKITAPVGKNYPQGEVKITEGGGKKLPPEIEYNKENRETIIPPTPQEVAEYAKQRGFSDPVGFGQHFVDYYAQAKWHLSNGKPMKDWRKAVITWEPNNKHRQFSAPGTAASKTIVPLDINTLYK